MFPSLFFPEGEGFQVPSEGRKESVLEGKSLAKMCACVFCFSTLAPLPLLREREKKSPEKTKSTTVL